MKKLFVLLSFLIVTGIAFCQSSQNKVQQLGFVSEIVYLKSSSENLAIRVLNDSTVIESDKIRFINQYNSVKTSLDQILLQLISDCNKKNSIKYFKKLDKAFADKKFSEISNYSLKNKRIKKYITNLSILNQQHNELISFNLTNKEELNLLGIMSLKGLIPTSASVEELTGVLSFITSTIKGVHERKVKKTEKVTSLLNELRIKPVQELLKKENQKKDK